MPPEVRPAIEGAISGNALSEPILWRGFIYASYRTSLVKFKIEETHIMDESKQKIALFIDADNAPANKFEEVLSEVAKYGVVTIRKAYGNWKSPTLKAWEDLLHEYAIQPVQQYDLTKGKNASDIALVIDAMDVIYTKNIDVWKFVSCER